jgi:CheY-like chemotaxis protein
MNKPLIRVVDDEQKMADSIAKIVMKSGEYDAISAYSGKEALDELKKNRQLLGIAGNKIKLILLDIKMPDMDGLQFLEKLRKEHKEEEFGVMMVTAYEDAEKWDRATSGFVAGYIKKPIVEKEVVDAVKRFFSNPDSRYKMTIETFEKHIQKREELK